MILIIYILIFFILVFVTLIGFKAANSGIKAKQKNKTLKKKINIEKNISQDLIRINKLYKSGAITKKEFQKAKDKILKN
jgi:uncharacterized membrane protein